MYIRALRGEVQRQRFFLKLFCEPVSGPCRGLSEREAASRSHGDVATCQALTDALVHRRADRCREIEGAFTGHHGKTQRSFVREGREDGIGQTRGFAPENQIIAATQGRIKE